MTDTQPTAQDVARKLDQAPTGALVDILARGTQPGPMSDTWASLTCYEAEAIAALMRRYGHPDAAATVIADHALADDDGDLHTRP